LVQAAISVIEMEEVFDAKMHSGLLAESMI